MQVSKSHGSVCVSVVAALLFAPAMPDRAYAFGGLWSAQSTRIEQADEAILFVDNPDSTLTAIVRIEYEGPPQKFAWVIPLPGKPVVGVSSNTVFDRLDAATAPEYWVEVGVEGACMPADAGLPAGGASSDADAMPGAVVAIDQGSVGPYDYATIEVDPSSSDAAQAATDWFDANGYALTSLDSDVLSPYLRDGLHLLAFKLRNDADAGAIQPVVLTYESKLPMIPIRPAAVSARRDMGVRVWVVGPSQAVPENYASLVINDARLDWSSGRKYDAGTPPAGGVGPTGTYGNRPRNYDAVVTAAVNEAGGRGFITELGAPVSQFRDKVWSPLDEQFFATVSTQSYADGLDAILAANEHYGDWDGWKEAVAGATTLPDGVTLEEFAGEPERYRGAVEVDTSKFLQLLDDKVVSPVVDAAALLYNAPYLTRLYTRMSAAQMTVDPTFNYNFDLAQVSNVHVAKQFIECTAARDRDDAAWRMELPQGGVVVGEGGAAWPVDDDSMPANLEVVMLSTSGSGRVVEDNREAIGTALLKSAGTRASGVATLHPPLNGVAIGGRQMVRVTAPASTHSPLSSARNPSGGNDCSVSRAGTGARSAMAWWFALAGMIVARLRRRSRARSARCTAVQAA